MRGSIASEDGKSLLSRKKPSVSSKKVSPYREVQNMKLSILSKMKIKLVDLVKIKLEIKWVAFVKVELKL